MAIDVSIVERTTFGNKAVQVLSCVADAATQTVSTDLGAVNWVSYSPKSMTAEPKLAINEGPGGTSIGGTIAVTGLTSGDEFWLTVYGR